MINMLLPQRAATVQTLGHPAAGVIGWFDSSSNASGVAVTEATALTYSAVWCAVRIISETIATLPCILYRRTADDSRERAVDDERYWLIHDEPHPLMNACTFFETLTSQMVLWGNGYARIVSDGLGGTMRFEPRQPDRMRQELAGEQLVYYCSDPLEERMADEMLHLLGLSSDGLVGYSVVKMAQQSIGSGMAADQQAARQFSNGATPQGLLVHPMRLDKEKREQLRRDWDDVHGGSNKSGKVAILHGGMDYKPVGMSNEDAQFLESRQFSIREIARWFRLPPHMLADLQDSSVRANIEQQAIEFVVYSLAPWLIRWQQTLNRKLLSRNERRGMYYEFLLDALLRGDIQSRYAAYSTARQWGWLSVNDIRRSENMNAVPNGDVYLQPSNMQPAGATVPDAISREFQANLADSITAIKDEQRQLRQEIAWGNSTVFEAYDRHTSLLNENLRELRNTRQEIKDDLAKAGQVSQVQGWTDERLDLFRQQLACCVKIEKSEVAKAARAQATRGKSFVAWLDNFSSLHAVDMFNRLGGYGDFCNQWCAESQRQLLASADGEPDGFCARVQAVLDSWDERVKEAKPCILN
jgi:HK97 family phage portal protein